MFECESVYVCVCVSVCVRFVDVIYYGFLKEHFSENKKSRIKKLFKH